MSGRAPFILNITAWSKAEEMHSRRSDLLQLSSSDNDSFIPQWLKGDSVTTCFISGYSLSSKANTGL